MLMLLPAGWVGWRMHQKSESVQAKGLAWARRTGPDAGDSGQLLHLPATQHVSRRDRRSLEMQVYGKRWRRKGLLSLNIPPV